MARFTINGTVLGLRSTPYDFVDENSNERREGISHRLVLFDQDATLAVECAVKPDQLEAFKGLSIGEAVSLPVDVFANGSKLNITAVPPAAAAPRAAKSA